MSLRFDASDDAFLSPCFITLLPPLSLDFALIFIATPPPAFADDTPMMIFH